MWRPLKTGAVDNDYGSSSNNDRVGSWKKGLLITLAVIVTINECGGS